MLHGMMHLLTTDPEVKKEVSAHFSMKRLRLPFEIHVFAHGYFILAKNDPVAISSALTASYLLSGEKKGAFLFLQKGPTCWAQRVGKHYPSFCWRHREKTKGYDLPKMVAFYETAKQFSTLELIHCLQFSALVEVTSAIEQLNSLCKEGIHFVDLRSMISRWHFTQTQIHQLKASLIRWNYHFPEGKIEEVIERCRSAKEVITRLDQCFH